MDRGTWIMTLERKASQLLQTADALLLRSPRQRRRAGVSLPMRMLSGSLGQLREYAMLLDEEGQQSLSNLMQSIEKRLEILRNRRVRPGVLLHRLYRQDRELKHLAYLEPQDWHFPRVLVGTLRRPSQLDTCLIHGFYHVPVSQIPQNRLPVDYIAIYQSRSLFKKDCGIRFYGRVKGCEIVQRWQISEIPKESREPYYRFEVLRWEQLETPIQVREVPFTHMFTNWFLLTHAKETPELFLRSPGEYRRYQAIQTALFQGDGPVFNHPGGRVWLKKGKLLVRHGGRTVAAFRSVDFANTPDTAFRRLTETLERNTNQK